MPTKPRPAELIDGRQATIITGPDWINGEPVYICNVDGWGMRTIYGHALKVRHATEAKQEHGAASFAEIAKADYIARRETQNGEIVRGLHAPARVAPRAEVR